VTPLVTPVSLVVIATVDVVDDHLTISMGFPMSPLAVTEVLHSHHSRGTTLDDHSPHGRPVTGVSAVYRYSPGDRTAANHNLC
jgi:hypothetical protein